MAKIKLTTSAVDVAQPQAQAIELRDAVVPGFMCKVTPVGRKVFMLQYRINAVAETTLGHRVLVGEQTVIGGQLQLPGADAGVADDGCTQMPGVAS